MNEGRKEGIYEKMVKYSSYNENMAWESLHRTNNTLICLV